MSLCHKTIRCKLTGKTSMTTKTILNSTNNKTLINTNSGNEVDNLSGTVVLEKYTLLNRINSPSGEAALYMAVNNASSDSLVQNQPLVVKIYRRKDAIKPDVLNKLAELKSSGIVEIIDHGFYNGFPCIVMPYYKNGSLAGKTLSYDVIKDIVIPEVTQGLKYLHKNGIIHKDIKPANLMISDDGMHIHIIDFGISSAKDGGVSVLITKTGMSPEYCAPETFNNVWVEESDYYSLGITLFELFKGHTPYDSSLNKGELAAHASIQKIPFSLDFPLELINLIKGLTYRDLSNRRDSNNPNRRWTWIEIEKWLKGETIPVPGELNSGNDTSNSDGNTNESSYIFSKPYDFRNNQGQIVKLNTLSEFTEAFGLNWNDGKKHVGRGFASKFFIQQDMQNAASIIMDCEDAGVTDFAYAKMLIELSGSTNNLSLYWNSVRIDNNMKILSDILTKKLFNQSNNLKEEYDNVKQLLILWYEKNEKNKELSVIEKLQQLADVNKHDIDTQIIALCSFIDPNIAVKIGDNIYKDKDELINFTNKIKNNRQQYYEWLLKNQNDIKRYTVCVYSNIKPIIDNMLKDLQPKLNRLKQEIQTFGIPLRSIKKGAYIKYGNYPQIADAQKAPIEWLILDFNEKTKEALLISRYGLDCKQYHHNYTDITWEDCDLRNWLNNDFIKSAFTEEEIKRIKFSKLKNEDNDVYRIKGGNDTKDRIFCLSITEAKQYFKRDNDRQCKPTAYAREQGAYVYDDCDGCCLWWLRTPGLYQNRAALVNEFGGFGPCGFCVNDGRNVVRPALRIICNLQQHEEEVRRQRKQQEIQTFGIPLSFIREGAFIKYGNYPLTADGQKAPIEWLVLDVNANEALLISRYGLDCKQYHHNYTDITWEDCDLRKWLNNDFIKLAFSEEDAKKIKLSKLENEGTRGGNEIKDRVFCLSIDEAEQYFFSEYDRQCTPTAYARNQGVYVFNDCCFWWLRSAGIRKSFATIVDTNGSLFGRGNRVDYVRSVIRPALWIDITSRK